MCLTFGAQTPTVIFASFQATSSPTGIPRGADMKTVGKICPNNYAAMRNYHTLPSVSELSQAKRAAFSGSIITLDFPQRGMVHVMNYKNGKRVVLDNPRQKTSDNGVPLTKMLSTLPPKVDIRYAGPNVAGFDVKLPGEEKKLIGFTGTLTAFATKPGAKGVTISVVEGKVQTSSWLKPTGLHN